MFTADYNFEKPEENVLVKEQDIFQNTLTIKSVHCYYGTVSYYKYTDHWEDEYGKKNYYTGLGCENGSVCCSPHRDVPIDIVYKSTPQGENIYITLGGYSTSNRLIFNINGKTNIELFKKDDMSDDYGNRLYFEITKEQFGKMCSATSLAIQISSSSGEVLFESDASVFITILQALYNETIDNTMYTNAKDNALSLLESKAANIQASNDVEMSKKTEFDNRRETISWGLIAFFVISAIVMLVLALS